MDVTNRFRQAGTDIRSVTARGVVETPDDTLKLLDTTARSRVAPNEEVTITAEVMNQLAFNANLFHEDKCHEGASTGWDTEVSAAVGNNMDTMARCIGFGGTTQFDLTFNAPPSEGEYDMEIEVYGQHSGEVAATETLTLHVVPEETAPGQRDDPDDGGSGPKDLALAAAGGGAILLVLLVALAFTT